MKDSTKIFLGAIAVIGIGIYAYRKGKASNVSSGTQTFNPSNNGGGGVILKVEGASNEPSIIAAVNGNVIPPPPNRDFTGVWYWNGKEWSGVNQTIIPSILNDPSRPRKWLVNDVFTAFGTKGGQEAIHTYNKNDVVMATYTPAVVQSNTMVGAPNQAAKLRWSDSNGDFTLIGDEQIHTYLLPPII